MTVLGQMGVSRPIDIAAGKTLTMKTTEGNYAQYTGVISGDGALAFSDYSVNPCYIQNLSNTFTGDITINAGSGGVIFSNNGAFGATGKTIYLKGGWLQWQADVAADRTLVIGGASQQLRDTGLAWHGLIQGGGFTFQGSHIVLTNPGNTFSGTIGMYAGGSLLNPSTLTVSHPGNINGNSISFVNPYNRLQVAGTPAGGWTGNISWGSYATFIDVVESAAVVNWTGQLSGSGVLTKTGPGAFVVNNTTATGDFDIQGGTILFNDTSTTGIGSHTVQNTAALGGNGTLSLGAGKGISVQNGGTLKGTVTVTGGTGVSVADGGIVAPGESAGTLTLSSLVLNNGSILNFELDAPNVEGGDNDVIQVNGDLTLDGVLYVTFTDTPITLQPYRLFSYEGVLTNHLLTVGTVLPKDGYIDTSIAGQVNLILIPEPATAAVLGLAGLALLRRRRF
ncbi:MAG: hypothetical protein BWZ02_00871 [Lentisphaerae bacterium ADurb.BinA184]|nr:MAG: hypothetical protein BWZ02_00871 [Lentisphaerae bacterium ADurb.BinA184]